MTLDDYNRFCRALTATTHVVQWGGAHVWKVGAKVFAIAREVQDDHALHVTFKCSPMSYDMLRQMPGCRPAPYLASRGMKWIQRTSAEGLDDEALKDYLHASYDLVVAGLPRRTREAIGLGVAARDAASRAQRKPDRAIATKPVRNTPLKSATTAKTTPRATAARAGPRKGAAT